MPFVPTGQDRPYFLESVRLRDAALLAFNGGLGQPGWIECILCPHTRKWQGPNAQQRAVDHVWDEHPEALP